jgi:hypothetical protein
VGRDPSVALRQGLSQREIHRRRARTVRRTCAVKWGSLTVRAPRARTRAPHRPEAGRGQGRLRPRIEASAERLLYPSATAEKSRRRRPFSLPRWRLPDVSGGGAHGCFPPRPRRTDRAGGDQHGDHGAAQWGAALAARGSSRRTNDGLPLSASIAARRKHRRNASSLGHPSPRPDVC